MDGSFGWLEVTGFKHGAMLFLVGLVGGFIYYAVDSRIGVQLEAAVGVTPMAA